MEIERINEDTVKFFLSYVDIEERGFTREEVWNNREKSEELFWDMIDEINEQSEFAVEGPLWIQVHAKHDGIEVTVTRATSNNGEMVESPFYDEADKMLQEQDDGTFEDIEDILTNSIEKENKWVDNIFIFKEFEDVIQVASRMRGYEAKTSLYTYEDKFYLYVEYDLENMDNKQKNNMFSVLSEFATPDQTTIHVLQEYGKVIIDSDVFEQIEQYF